MTKIPPVFFLLLFFVCAASTSADASVIPVTKFRSLELPGGAPIGWALEKKVGTPSLKMEKHGDNYYLHLLSHGNSSFGVRTSSRVNVKEFPIISWRWKVNKLPVGGDVRKKAADDQALQVYIAFKETGFPAALNTPVIGYVWDNEAPKGWSGRSTQVGGNKLRYIVLRNKTDKTGQWYTERRNIYEDYKRLFSDINGGEPLGVTTGLQLYINTQRTKTPAEGVIGEICFNSEVKEIAATEKPIAVQEKPREKIVARTPVISAPKRKSFPKTAEETLVVENFDKPGCINISIEFETNSIEIDENGGSKMQPLSEYLLKYPRARLTITGHTDNTGSDTYNLLLSRLRAESVRNFLVEKYKIDEQRIILKGAGPSLPVADNGTPEGQAQNRRVMIQTCPE
jgi:outer membrane protein OmpA-like peptidoglycan-associated protein